MERDLVKFHRDLTGRKNPHSKGNGTPAISGKSRLVKYYSIWPDAWHVAVFFLFFVFERYLFCFREDCRIDVWMGCFPDLSSPWHLTKCKGEAPDFVPKKYIESTIFFRHPELRAKASSIHSSCYPFIQFLGYLFFSPLRLETFFCFWILFIFERLLP